MYHRFVTAIEWKEYVMCNRKFPKENSWKLDYICKRFTNDHRCFIQYFFWNEKGVSAKFTSSGVSSFAIWLKLPSHWPLSFSTDLRRFPFFCVANDTTKRSVWIDTYFCSQIKGCLHGMIATVIYSLQLICCRSLCAIDKIVSCDSYIESHTTHLLR